MTYRAYDVGLFNYSKVCERHNLNDCRREGYEVFNSAGMNLIGFDVETTGLSPKSGDRIVSLGAVKVDYKSGAVIDQFSTLINPCRDVGATFIHGITDEDVQNAPLFKDAYPSLLDFFSDGLIVGHNLRFDEGFLSSELKLAGFLDRVTFPSICTLRLAQKYLQGCSNHKLESCAAAFDIEVKKYHDAACDALASVEILRSLIGRANLEIMVPLMQKF